ncbi:hypothetical protein [Actinophytocola sp. KF-1]
MAPATEFEGHRTTLFGHADRLLGSAAETEDIVRAACLRWDRAATAHPGAWPAKVVTNLTATFVAGS